MIKVIPMDRNRHLLTCAISVKKSPALPENYC
jgi:hypothetical protein